MYLLLTKNIYLEFKRENEPVPPLTSRSLKEIPWTSQIRERGSNIGDACWGKGVLENFGISAVGLILPWTL